MAELEKPASSAAAVRVSPWITARSAARLSREVFPKGETVAESERVLIYAVRDGQLSECWVYDADPELVERFVED